MTWGKKSVYLDYLCQAVLDEVETNGCQLELVTEQECGQWHANLDAMDVDDWFLGRLSMHMVAGREKEESHGNN